MKPFIEDSLRDTGRAVLGGAERGPLEACFFSCPTPPTSRAPETALENSRDLQFANL